MNYLRIKELLKERGASAKDLASYLDVTETGMSMIINGKRQPRFEVLQKIAEYFDVKLWELFSESEGAVTGVLEYCGRLYRIRKKADLEDLLRILK